ncbi:hypothetical protein, partial [Vibrio vulnificus]|uniref:hypothetical protein n=1 Tax=Vibrio vulnificus TaxID=672 RepID=UPI0019D4BF1B
LASKMIDLFKHTPVWCVRPLSVLPALTQRSRDEADNFISSCHKVEVILAQWATLYTKFEGREHLFIDLYRQNEAYLDVPADDRRVI